MCKEHSTRKPCKRCFKVFTPSKGFANYCSHKCKYNKRPVDRSAVKKRADKLRKPTAYTCQNTECGMTFLDKPSAKRKYCSPSCASKVRTNDPEFKRKARLRAVEQGFGGNKSRGQHGWYESPTAGRVYLESSYEFKVAEELDAKGIRWIRPKKTDAFIYNFEDEERMRRYEPDFFLPDYNVYLDPKNDYRIKLDKAKIRIVRQRYSVRILVLKENQLDWDSISALIGVNSPMKSIVSRLKSKAA